MDGDELAVQNTVNSAPDQASSMALMLDSKTMESALAIAEVMSKSKVTVPKHLQGQQGDCMAIVLQSMNWGMNPFAVAQKTHIVNGALGYEAQLVNAVVSSQGFIKGAFKYEYQGESNMLECRVGAVIKGENKVTWGQWLRLADVKIQNSPLWKTNPRQQLGYLQCKNWTRLYCPGAILGVYTPDELEDIEPKVKDVTPQNQSATEAAQASQQSQTSDKNLYASLNKIASKQGLMAYQEAWEKLTADQRKAIGTKLHTDLKEIAAAYDDENPPYEHDKQEQELDQEFVDQLEGKK